MIHVGAGAEAFFLAGLEIKQCSSNPRIEARLTGLISKQHDYNFVVLPFLTSP